MIVGKGMRLLENREITKTGRERESKEEDRMDLLTRRSLTFDFLSSWRIRVHRIFGRES